jgi:hypothetical protein
MLQFTQGSWTYAAYTQQFKDFLRMFLQQFSDVFKCVTFIKGLSSFQLHTQATYHRSYQKDYIMLLVELKIFLNDFVPDSPNFGQASSY